jgi:translation initiation factor 1 (eIF-1/SUI1)
VKVQRWEATDELLRGDEAAILIRGNVVRLTELSTVIYLLTERAIDVRDLAKELESRFGVPADGSTLSRTKDAVAELIRYGILHRA